MRLKLGLLGALVCALVIPVPAAAQLPPPTQTQQQFPLVFKDEIQVYVFHGTTTPGTTLRGDTRDCCIPGDIWGVRIFASAGGGGDDGDDDGDDNGDDNGNGLLGSGRGDDDGGDDDGDDDGGGGGALTKVAEACGTGSTTQFTGEAAAQVSGYFVVEVFQCAETDPPVIPSGMDVRFRYQNGTGAAVPYTPPECQDPDKSCEPAGGYPDPTRPTGGGGGEDDGDDD